MQSSALQNKQQISFRLINFNNMQIMEIMNLAIAFNSTFLLRSTLWK